MIRDMGYLNEVLVYRFVSIIERALCQLSLGLDGGLKSLKIAEKPLGFHFAVILIACV